MTDRPNQSITFRMVITHATVLGVVAAMLGWLGQFFYWTRAEGAAMESKLAVVMEAQRHITDILIEVKDELKELRRGTTR